MAHYLALPVFYFLSLSAFSYDKKILNFLKILIFLMKIFKTFEKYICPDEIFSI